MTTTFYRPAELLEPARIMLDPWNNHYSLDHARTLVLIVICLNEMNLESAAWNWLGNAVQVGQDLGLYAEIDFVDDQYLQKDGPRVPGGAETLTHSLLTVIHVVRSYTGLVNALQRPVLSAAQLATFDALFKQCLGTFPPARDLASTVALAPHFLAPLA
ncbi:hypothetical protein E4U61_003352 [Claviceps capensis]|nr:hypothetical protein E4U61_003352 [Claviceps capensis]